VYANDVLAGSGSPGTGTTPSWMSRVTAASWMAVFSPAVASMTSETA
jgi:hypothetical protein